MAQLPQSHTASFTAPVLLQGHLRLRRQQELPFSSLSSRCTTVTFASVLPSNATLVYAVPYGGNSTFDGSISNLPSLCALYFNVTSSNSSSFDVGLWLPVDTWNNGFIAYENGGFVGQAACTDMAKGLDYGFAAVSTNTGHNSSFMSSADGDWALNAPEKRTDWGWRALHGSMFPDDFDGVVTGAPSWWITHLQQWNLKVATYNLPNTTSYHIPQALISAIADEVFRQWDDVDGLGDGIITNPCLTTDQIGSLYKLYNDWIEVNQTSEAQWSQAIISSNESSPGGFGYARYFLYNDSNWTWEDLDYSTVQLAEEFNPGNATADDYDLRPFMERGGKLIHYHGLADGSISMGLLQPKGVQLSDFYWLFLIPGIANQAGSRPQCPRRSGPQTRRFTGPALISWVENNTAPNEIIATKLTDDDPSQGVMMQRPLCSHPKEAKYVSGNPNVTTSFECEVI
ncbi:feruloyl esterase B precursor [Sphaerosporella brunnea]|uniref:Carboxylic ester hydrolase n=1 Tax=Sphaerosporella brunnea TaxID=1250544 RepID=A0A5J5ELN2_9PEZI|nr:feruloyl esterase B precursor [Sphaerosporella brunnea]